jgi:hypothetical protein
MEKEAKDPDDVPTAAIVVDKQDGNAMMFFVSLQGVLPKETKH